MKEVGILLIFLMMVSAMSALTDSFATRSNLISILEAIAPIAIMGVGQTLVILTAGIDLSVGSVCALSAYVMSLVLTSPEGYPLSFGILAAIAAGAACGGFSGFVIAKLRVTPFIVTLGMLSAASGLTLGLSGGKQIGLNKFGKGVATSESILNPGASIEGRPDVERKFYADGAETTAILPLPDGKVWVAASEPSTIHLLDEKWAPITHVALDEGAVGVLMTAPDGGVFAAGDGSGVILKIDPDGDSRSFLVTGAESVHALADGKEKTIWVGTGSPALLLEADMDGKVISRIEIPAASAVTSVVVPPDGFPLLSTAAPASLARFHGGSVETMYESDADACERLRIAPDGALWFLESTGHQQRLMRFEGGAASLVWDPPKRPFRDFLVFPNDIAVAAAGNMGSVYLIRPGKNPHPLHPMTQHKGRVLAKGSDDLQLLVGNAGPAGVGTLSTVATKTLYPVAETFNQLYVWSPLVMILLVFAAWFFLRFTKWGTYLYAIGGNETAARLSGVNVDRMKWFAYVVTGALSGLAAVFMTSKIHTLDPNLARGYELKVIAAVVIGGTSLMGGEGSVWGTLIGAALLYVMNSALVHLGMEPIWSDLFIGAIIILAAVLDSSRGRMAEFLEAFWGRAGSKADGH